MKNQIMNDRKIICAIVLFWLYGITSTGICLAAEEVHAEKHATPGADTLDALRYIREEVKLARDLYGALTEIWGLDVFENTAKRKQSLMNAVSNLLKRYGVDDPAGDGFAIGAVVFVIRTWGGYPDAVAFAVLLLNIAAPMIDYYTQPRVFGQRRPAG